MKNPLEGPLGDWGFLTVQLGSILLFSIWMNKRRDANMKAYQDRLAAEAEGRGR